jgi:glycosyltransferase involved in cell wall biosynthesis
MPEIAIGFDTSPLLLTVAGVNRYITSLLAALEETGEVSIHRYALPGRGRIASVGRDVAWYLGALPRAARRDSVDVLHCPTQRAPTRARVPLLVTVHDVATLRLPDAFNAWTRRYTRALLPRVVHGADRVIAVSEFTASELRSLLGVPSGKIAVVPNGVGAPFVPDGVAADGDYVLAVATVEPRKNLERLADAVHALGPDGPELRLVGAQGWGLVRLDERVTRLGVVTDEELAQLYRGARCLAYVPLYEGFGLPVLEAMASGTPVVASDIPALREVAGGAAVYVDPLETEDIARGLREAGERRGELIEAGRERASGFSWKKTADATLEVYREMLA